MTWAEHYQTRSIQVITYFRGHCNDDDDDDDEEDDEEDDDDDALWARGCGVPHIFHILHSFHGCLYIITKYKLI